MTNQDLLEILTKALPYVERAYECAFPDQVQNDYLAQNIKDAIEEMEHRIFEESMDESVALYSSANK